MAKKIELYTFGEVVKELGINSRELNDIITQGKLAPVRHQGRLKFKKETVDQLKEARRQKALESSGNLWGGKQEEEYYGWDKVLLELQIEEADLQELIANGSIQAYEGKDGLCFNKREVFRIKVDRQSRETMLMTPSMRGMSGFSALFEEIPDPSEDFSLKNEEELYKVDRVLTILQMEQVELDRMVAEGDLTVVHTPQGLKYKKAEVEMLRHERMIEATVVVTPENIVEEDEEIVPIVISANETGSMEKISREEEEYCTFDEAAYELQIDPAELKRMIARQEIQAVNKDGQFKFRRQDIKSRGVVIEPTVILPDDEQEEEEEETVNLEENAGSTLEMDEGKSFYTSEEAAAFLGVEPKEIARWIEEKKLKTYLYESRKKIKRQDLLKLKSELGSHEKNAGERFYTLEETLRLLRIEEKELKIMVAKGKLPVKRGDKGYRFSQDAVDALALERQDSAVPKKNEPAPAKRIPPKPEPPKPEPPKPEPPKPEPPKPEPPKSSPSKPAPSKASKNLSSPAPSPPKTGAPKAETPSGEVEITMVLPLFDEPPKAPSKAPQEKKKPAPPRLSPEEIKKNYYSVKQAQIELQLEQEELDSLLRRGSLPCEEVNGQRYIPKQRLDELKKGKMIEPTVLVEDGGGDDVLDDEEDDMLFFQ